MCIRDSAKGLSVLPPSRLALEDAFHGREAFAVIDAVAPCVSFVSHGKNSAREEQGMVVGWVRDEAFTYGQIAERPPDAGDLRPMSERISNGRLVFCRTILRIPSHQVASQ